MAADAPLPGPLLELSGIRKAFGHTQALADAEFELVAGEVHALCGANGAGKSTLSRVVTGQIRPDAGRIVYRGRQVAFTSARDALRQQISIVMQETSLCLHLSVLENIFLPALGTRGRLSYSALRAKATRILHDLDPAHRIALGERVSDLSIGRRQLIEIAKAVALDSQVIIFDEPTASFSPQEVEHLFDVMRMLAAEGKGLVFVSHRLEEIFAIADRVTVLRDGRTVARSVDLRSISPNELVGMMVGHELTDLYAHATVPQARDESPGSDPLLEVRHLSALPEVKDVSFAVHAGEILGLGGLVGAGRSETVEAIFGLRHVHGGEVRLAGRRVRFKTPAHAIAAGIGLIAEDRRRQGIVPDLSVKENLLLVHLGRHSGWGKGYHRHGAAIAGLLDELGLPDTRVLAQNMLNLSGGQQQKIILARWLLMQPKVLLLDEPTRGVDIGTRSSIYEILRKIAALGVALVVISSDFEELLGLSDRVVVISDGTTVTDIAASYLNIERLTLLAAPRTSAEATHATLESLVRRFGGTAYWITCDGERVCCFDSAEASDGGVDTGLRPGHFPRLGEVRIGAALHAMADEFSAEPDGQSWSLLTPLRNHRGVDLGLIGLTLPEATARPPAAAVRQLVRTAMERGRSATPKAPA